MLYLIQRNKLNKLYFAQLIQCTRVYCKVHNKNVVSRTKLICLKEATSVTPSENEFAKIINVVRRERKHAFTSQWVDLATTLTCKFQNKRWHL